MKRRIMCPSGTCNETLELQDEAFGVTENDGLWSAALVVRCPRCTVEFTITNSRVNFTGVGYPSIKEFNEKYG